MGIFLTYLETELEVGTKYRIIMGKSTSDSCI